MKSFYLALTASLSLLLIGCSKNQIEPTDGEQASVCFTFQLPQKSGNSMTKVSDEDIFAEFYEKILSAELVAPQYDLVLTDESTNIKYEFKGTWNRKDMVSVRTGRYHVVGTSTATGVSVQDKCSFVFDEYIDISSSATQITLTAQYDCFLIIFNAADISTLANYNGTASCNLFNFSTYKYAFVNDKLYLDDKQDLAYLNGQYTDGTEFKCYTGQLAFEKGKYYIHDSVLGTFSVPPMENGSLLDDNIEQPEGLAVDLGLSVKWSTCNIGASSPEEDGEYFSWGELSPKSYYSLSNYVFRASGDSYENVVFSKYVSNALFGTIDNKTILELEDDVANVSLGGNWRIPTKTEWEALCDSCTWTGTTINGIIGCMVTSKVNGNSIFIPAVGCIFDSQLGSYGVLGEYWSSSLHSSPYAAWHLRFEPGSNGSWLDHFPRYYGLPIRPVYDN